MVRLGCYYPCGGLKDHNGAQTQTGMWQAIGGGMIIAAAALFSQVQL